jgi:hypothetical protein
MIRAAQRTRLVARTRRSPPLSVKLPGQLFGRLVSD